MATWTGAALTADELAQLALDKPLIGAAQAGDLITAAASMRWVAGALGDFGDTDRGDTNFPILLAVDRKHHARTKPSGASGTTFSLLFNFGATPPDIDSIFIVGHNLGTLGSTVLTVTVADNNLLTTNPRLLFTSAGIVTDNRIAILGLDDAVNDPSRISDGQYWRIGLTTSVSGLPQFGEIWFSRRRQLFHHSDLPYGDTDEETNTIRAESESGVIFDNTLAEGRSVKKAKIRTKNSDEEAPLDGWWTDAGRGAKGFVWVEKPSTAPNTFQVYKSDGKPRKSAPLQGPFDRVWSINMKEQGPFIAVE